MKKIIIALLVALQATASWAGSGAGGVHSRHVDGLRGYNARTEENREKQETPADVKEDSQESAPAEQDQDADEPKQDSDADKDTKL